jgi:peptidoglycan-N-acetylglucosamine deacetylase
MTGDEANGMLADLWSVAKLKPSLMLTNYFAGKYYLSKKDAVAAAPFIEKAAACNPEFADVRLLLRHCYARQGFAKVTGVGTTSKIVALTFDDGPNPNTEALLDILDLCGVKATFFVVGSQVEMRKDLVRSMMERGHEIENHTYSHRNMTQLTELDAERELLRGAAAVRDATGHSPAFFRPPGGHLSGSAQAAAAKYGWTGVMWTLACSKFEGGLPDNIIDYVCSKIGEGGIVLMHNGEDATMKALPAVVTELRNKGYHFVTVSELVGRR